MRADLHHPREEVFLKWQCADQDIFLDKKHEIHYVFYSLPEVPNHMLLPQSFELPCMAHSILVLAFMPHYFWEMFVFMDLIIPFGVSGDVTGYINMQNPHLFTFGNTKLQYMSTTTQVVSKETQWAELSKNT